MLTSSATSSGRATGSGRAAAGAGRASTGIPGLDDIFGGGLTPDRVYLVEGTPGTGKTTLALQFLIEGVRLGEPALYITLSETAEELRAVAASHGWSLDGIDALRARRRERAATPMRAVDPASLRSRARRDDPRGDGAGRRAAPARVVFDSLSEMRLLAQRSAALSAPDPGAQAVLLDPAVHRADARRPTSDAGRSAAALHLPTA